jgi:hypothetical protein
MLLRRLRCRGGGGHGEEGDVEDEEKRRLKSANANMSVENELLREKIVRLEDGGVWLSGSRNDEPHRFAFQ